MSCEKYRHTRFKKPLIRFCEALYKRKFLFCLTAFILAACILLAPVLLLIDHVKCDDNEFDFGNAPFRHFDIAAISLQIVYNKEGDHDPNGMMYVLKEDEQTIRGAVNENPLAPSELVQPLVIRANAGDLINVDFENKLDRRASIHIQGVRYDVQTSDGAAVGYNSDTTTSGKITYQWYAEKEGVFLFHDMSTPVSSEGGSNLHGLFGVLIVEPAGSIWTDPVTGEELRSGCYADIHHPSIKDFREYVTIFHDEPALIDRDGNPPASHETGQFESTMPINYRS